MTSFFRDLDAARSKLARLAEAEHDGCEACVEAALALGPPPPPAVVEVAAKYDDEDGELTAAVLRRLDDRVARAGRTCSKCGERKPLSAFGPDLRDPAGLDRRCRACESGRRREARAV